jgi:hypothetical protein
MTVGGWIFMLGSIGFVLGLIIFCYSRVLRKPNGNHLHTPEQIDPYNNA